MVAEFFTTPVDPSERRAHHREYSNPCRPLQRHLVRPRVEPVHRAALRRDRAPCILAQRGSREGGFLQRDCARKAPATTSGRRPRRFAGLVVDVVPRVFGIVVAVVNYHDSIIDTR